jgi:hypothetical protein
MYRTRERIAVGIQPSKYDQREVWGSPDNLGQGCSGKLSPIRRDDNEETLEPARWPQSVPSMLSASLAPVFARLLPTPKAHYLPVTDIHAHADDQRHVGRFSTHL